MMQAGAHSSVWWKAYGKDPEVAAEALASKLTWREKTGLMQGHEKSWNGYTMQRGFFVGTVAGIPSVGIPPLNAMDAGQGYRTYYPETIGTVTAWPSNLALAATWDASLAFRYARALGAEFRAKRSNVLLGPAVDIARVGGGGRNGESLCGEDPQLCAPLVVEYVKGLKSKGVAAVLKHFAVNTQETNRGSHNNYASERAKWEVYYAPYQSAIDAGVASVMCAYNGVDGTRSCENPELLKKDLKQGMGFKGFVMSDWWAMKDKVAGSTGGLDMNMAGNKEIDYSPPWDDADFANMGDDAVHDSVRRILWGMLNSGAYDYPDHVCIPGLDSSCRDLAGVDVTSDAHIRLAHEVAAASVVMLQNDGVLPLARGLQVLVVGSACAYEQDVNRDWGWDEGDYYVNGGSGRVLSPRTASVLKGILESGSAIQGPKDDNVEAALDAMRRYRGQAAAVIACGGVASTEGKDRDSLKLDQHDFLVQLAAESKKRANDVPLIIITMSGGAVRTDFRSNTNALLSVFFTGQETGRALADVLYGDVNPSGRSPVTFPVNEGDMEPVCFSAHCHLQDGLNVGWRNLIGKPVAFPFGHGLSYTSFTYQWAVTPVSKFDANVGQQPYEVIVDVRNEGASQGQDVVQLYLRFPAMAGEPEKLLRGFHRTSLLRVGESEKVTFKLHMKDFSVWSDQAHKWQVFPGMFGLEVAASSRDVRLFADVDVVSNEDPELQPTSTPSPEPHFGFPTGVPVYIRSHRQQNLKDHNGRVWLTGNSQDWELWTIIDAGNGKVTIRSHRNAHLQDNNGHIGLSGNEEAWEQWVIKPVGNGKVTICSHRNQFLQDANGHVGLSDNKDLWEQWSLHTPDPYDGR